MKKPALLVPDAPASQSKTYFTRESSYTYAGMHLLLEFWNARNLDDIETGRRALVDAVSAAGCTLLDLSLHRFSPHNGFSGVAVLMESHISIHTWPELRYAAIDIFTCGSADPHKAVPVLKAAFQPEHMQLCEHRRGVMP